jgi:hypothetical protein
MEHLVNENRRLGEANNLLRQRLDMYIRLFEMSLDVIEKFSHFVPNVAKKYKEEVEGELSRMEDELSKN